MVKINVTDEFKESHNRYFEINIIPNLSKNDIQFDCIESGYFYNKYGINNIQSIHDNFIDYCVQNAKRISIGDFNELRNIQDEIENLFPCIIKLIKDKNFKFSNPCKKYKGKMYWEALVDIFGYNQFGNCNLYDVIKESSKKYLDIDNLTNPSDKLKVQNKMIHIIKILFPQIIDVIDNEFSNINSNNIMNMDDFKQVFIDFEKQHSLTLTLDNYKNIQSYGVWNSYLFVYASGLRTCPYCNRQYVTPVLTSTGKMRATLDHFLPKNEYPYFSMSLYNLVPACYSCNSSLKGEKEFNIDDINPYYESLDDYIRFFADINLNKEISIDVLHKKLEKYDEVNKYIRMFKLKEQYNYHVNQVEELILKRYMYSEQYIRDIKENKLNKFDISEKQIKEQIIGYTEDKIKINDEPLSKFRRDIVEQLGFFDEYDLYLENKLEEILNDK